MKIKKVLLGVTLSLATALSLAGCKKNNDSSNTESSSSVKEEVTLNLDKATLELVVGDSSTLNATASSQVTLTWSSSNPDVASVENGLVKALKAGETTIRVSISEKVYKECKVTVSESLVTPTLILNKDELSIKVDGTYTLKPTCMLGTEIASNVTYNYSSSDESVVSVDATGKVSGLKAGNATITVKATVNGKEVSATCDVVVSEDLEINVDVEKIDLSLLALNDNDKDSHQIDVEVIANGTSKDATFTFTSKDPTVAAVSETGLVSSVGIGSTEIEIVATYDGKELRKNVEVEVIRTSQEAFDISAANYSDVMVTTPTVGYLSEQILSVNVAPYDTGLDIKWSIDGNGATLTKQADNRNIKVSIDPASLGGSFTVNAILEGNAETAVSFTINSYIPISNEESLVAMNERLDATNNIVGKYLLTNDIILNNDVASRCNNGAYTKAIVGSDATPFIGEFDGNGYTISNAKFAGGTTYLGIIAKVGDGGYIHNLGVEAEFEQNNLSAGIAGWVVSMSANPARVSNCYAKVTLANTSKEKTWPGAGITGRLEGWNGSVDHCFVEVSTIAGNGVNTLDAIGSIIGRSYYSNFTNCYVVVDDSEFANKVAFVGNDQAGANGKKEFNILTNSIADLYVKGFTADSLDSNVWKVTDSSIKLVKGCTTGAIAYVSCVPTLSIEEGKTANVGYTASVDDLVFSSDNEEVATVDSTGKVEAIKVGTANITVKSSSNNELVDTCVVTVLEAPKAKIVLDEEYVLTLYSLGTNDHNTLQLAPKFTLNDVEQEVTFTYSIDGKYVSINETGLLSALALGDDAIVKVSTIYNNKVIEAQVDVKVVLSTYTVEASTTPYSQALLTKEVTGYYTGEELVANVTNYVEDMEITWSSSNDVVVLTPNTENNLKATIKQNGKTGNATIMATVKDFGAVATFTVTVYDPISSEADLVALNDKASNNIINGNYLLTNDIVMASTYTEAVIGTQTVTFNGSFNGNGYTVSNLKFTGTTLYKGLFCKVMDKAHIYNLAVEAEFESGNLSGAICGWAYSTTGIVIENCYAKVTLPLKAENVAFPAGGILGRIEMWNVQVKNCLSELNVVDGTGPATCEKVGGIVGRSFNGDVLNCYTITSSDKVAVRGLLSNEYGKTEGCIISSNVADLGTTSLSSSIWNITQDSISLKKGCTFLPVLTE